MHPYAAYPTYGGAPNPYAQPPAAAAAYTHPHAAAAAYPHPQPYAAAGYGAPAYPPAPAYYNPVVGGYHAAVPASIAVAPVAAPVEEAAPLSPISAARAKEAAMIALSLEQAARPPPPAAAVAATKPASSSGEEEEPARDPNELEMKLENAHYNLPEVLGMNLVAHPYYRDLSHISSVEEVVDEIYAQVKHVEPMVAGKDRLPSTALFLLYKLFTLGVTKRQMNELLRHKGSPYIRAIGFLFLRCVYEPKGLWSWFEPFLSDQTVFVPGQQDKSPMTIASFIRELLEKNEYYGMKLRRIPIPVQRDYQLKLLALDARIKRSAKNEPYRSYLVKGTRLQAEYFQDSKFYDATIDRTMEGSGNFIVTFLGFGNQEEVDIGALKIPAEIVERAEEEERLKRRGLVPKERGAAPVESSHRSSESSRAAPSSSRDRDADRHRDSRERDSRSSSHRDRDRDGGHRSKRSSRSRSRSRDRHRSHRSGGGDRSRDRSRERSSRDRCRRSSRSHSRSPSSHSRGGDVFSDLPPIVGHVSHSAYASASSSSSSSRAHRARDRSPSPEVSLDALLRKERESSVAQGKDYARRPTSFKDSLSMSLLTGTTRKRSRTPPPVRRPESSSLAPIEEAAAPTKTALSEEQKAARAAILAKYGDAGSSRPAPKKRAAAGDDEDIIRLGM